MCLAVVFVGFFFLGEGYFILFFISIFLVHAFFGCFFGCVCFH